MPITPEQARQELARRELARRELARREAAPLAPSFPARTLLDVVGDVRLAPLGPPLRDYPATAASAANLALFGLPRAIYERTTGQPYPEPHSLPGRFLALGGLAGGPGAAALAAGRGVLRAVPALAKATIPRLAARGAVEGAVGGGLADVTQPGQLERAGWGAAGGAVLQPAVTRIAQRVARPPRPRPQTLPELAQVPEEQVSQLPPKEQRQWFTIRRHQIRETFKQREFALKVERQLLNRDIATASTERALEIRSRLREYLPKRSQHFRDLVEADMGGRQDVIVPDEELRQYVLKRYEKNPEVLTGVSARLGLPNTPPPPPAGQLRVTQAGEILAEQAEAPSRTLGQLYQQAKEFGQTLPQAVRQSLRLYDAEEYLTDKAIGTLMDFLETKGVDLGNARGFWRTTSEIMDQAVSEFRPFLLQGTRTQIAANRLRKLALGLDENNEVYAKTLADYLGVDSLPGEVKGIVAKLDVNQKAQLALQVAQREATNPISPLAQAQYVAGKSHEVSVEKWNRVLQLLKWIAGGASFGAGIGGALSLFRRE